MTNMATSLVQARVDENLKNQAAEVYGRLGMDLSTAIRIFLKRSVLENGIPFSMTLPSSEQIAESAISAIYEASAEAVENGTSELSLKEINEEIRNARQERK